MRQILTLLGVLTVTVVTNGHVSLTFPRANAPAYDFLDNVRTGPPCGIPLNNSSPRTKLVASQSYNFTFHLAYPHRGGFCLNLLNSTGDVVYGLTDGFVEANLSTSRQYTVMIPDLTCSNCYIQLIRQALEWVGPGSYGRVYLFWSCANVNVVASGPPSDCGGTDCTGHGTCTAGKCQCTGTWYGDYCQYLDGCRSDSDCNGHGRCVDLSSTSPPEHECFCDAGWQGLTCDKTSPLTSAVFDPKDYTGYLRASSKLEYWYRYVSASTAIEVAIKYSGTEWVGFGFRPADLTSNCWMDGPGFNAATPKNGSVAPWEGASKGESWGTPLGGGAEEEEEEEEEPEEEGAGLHPMDCTDIVIARVDGNQHRILDYYTRDRSTPQLDDWYGGTQNLIGAVGAHVDGVTWIRYMKPTRTSPKDKFDHDILNTTMNIIWAHGQVIGSYAPIVPPPPVSNPNFVANFYQPRELKYHGLNNRGRHSDNLINPAKVTPATCSYTNPCAGGSGCYQAKWGLHPQKSNIVVFELTRGGTSANWVGIGFSDDNRMPNSDIVTGIVGTDGVMVKDRWASQKSLPPVDPDQSQIVSASGSASDTKLTIQFQRTLTSTDSTDLSLNVGRFLLFAWGDVANNEITYHTGLGRAFTNAPVDVTKCTFTDPITSDQKPPTEPTSPPTSLVCKATHPCGGSNCMTIEFGAHPTESDKFIVDMSVGGTNTEWVGVGFSDDQKMPNSDIFTGTITSDGTTDVKKRTATVYSLPTIDGDQSAVVSAGSSTSGGKIRVQFQTTLPEKIMPAGGRYILLAHGKIGSNGITKHSETFVSPELLDVRKCPAYEGDIISGARANVASLFLLLAATLCAWLVC